MFRNEITINTISLRSNSSERLGRCGGRRRGEEKKERKKKKGFKNEDKPEIYVWL